MRGGRVAAGAAALAVVATALFSTACQRYGTEAASPPVAMGVSPQVTDKVENAQAAYIGSLRTIATEYDAAVCQEEDQMAQSGEEIEIEAGQGFEGDPEGQSGLESQSRLESNETRIDQESIAMSEANLEVADAWSTAKESVEGSRGGGPLEGQKDMSADGQKGIVVWKTAAPEKVRDRGGWTCQNASGEPACVAATANSAARKVYRDDISDINMNPVTVGDAFEALAADAAWADQYLVDAPTQAEAYDQIRQKCEAGESPLAQFFRAAADFDNREVRRDLMAMRDEFVGVNQNVCDALPVYYENMLTELRSDLSLRIRNNRCTAQRWDAVWE